MEFTQDDPARDSLRTVFDRAAEDYQRTRPVCPPQLFDDLIDLAGLEAGDRVLEIGCGTGQATVPLAERGLAITAVELGPELAAVASLRYPFQARYRAEDYLASLATQSSTHALGEARRAEFLARVRHRLQSLGWPRLTATFVGYLIVGRRA